MPSASPYPGVMPSMRRIAGSSDASMASTFARATPSSSASRRRDTPDGALAVPEGGGAHARAVCGRRGGLRRARAGHRRRRLHRQAAGPSPLPVRAGVPAVAFDLADDGLRPRLLMTALFATGSGSGSAPFRRWRQELHAIMLLDLTGDAHATPQAIELGFRVGRAPGDLAARVGAAGLRGSDGRREQPLRCSRSLARAIRGPGRSPSPHSQ